MNNNSLEKEIWFASGSQHLYGPKVLQEVASHSQEISRYFDETLRLKIVFKGVLTTPDEILSFMKEVNYADQCIGTIVWMHTFSPSKMWINGLKVLHKPLMHLHTQYNTEIPWNSIDMNFMNLNQSAHGGREFGFINTRMSLKRKVVVGHWKSENVIQKIERWSRVLLGWNEMQTLKVARIGDNMRQVAVTEGNKVSAEIQFGFSVNGYGIGDLNEFIKAATDQQIDQLIQEYNASYLMQAKLVKGASHYESLVEAAKIEIGLRGFLTEGGFKAFTDTFEDLNGLRQLPGIAVQRLMNDGYGFGAEGDWKTAALVRAMKVMGAGLKGGNSFMEDYTYHFGESGGMVLGSHMLEICPSISKGEVKCEVHPLGIGGKEDPVRLVFNGGSGDAINVALIDLGNRFRFVINEVSSKDISREIPKLPVARVLWEPKPNMEDAAKYWILAGGAHHTCYSQNLRTADIEDLAEIFGVESVVIDGETEERQFKQNLRNNEVYYHLKGGF